MSTAEFTHEVCWLTAHDLRLLLDVDSLIAAVRDAMKAVSNGVTELPLRRGMPLGNSGNVLGMMPGALLDESPVFGIKLVSLFSSNSAHGLPSHMGLYVLFEAENGKPVAVMDGNTLTALRTAAASAVATDALARADSRVLTILGTGEQSAAHLKAIPSVRNIDEIRIWGRDAGRAEALAQSDGRAVAVTELAAAMAGCDILCTVTSSATPLVNVPLLSPGMHINAVGSSHAAAMEIAPEVLGCCSVFIDFEASARDQAGEIIRAVEAGYLSEQVYKNEIGRVLCGELAGRQSEREVTLYKSLGVAAQDLAAARLAYTRASAKGIGTKLRL